jgi:hypothetical protein
MTTVKRSKKKDPKNLTKECSSCKEEKVIFEFVKNSRLPSGYSGLCKCCKNKRVSLSNNRKDNIVKYNEIKDTNKSKCTVCGEEKNICEFYFSNNKKLHSSECKACTKEYVKKYKENNRTKVLEAKKNHHKKYYSSKKESPEFLKNRSIQTKKWRNSNKSKVKEYNKQYKNSNRDLCSAIANKRRVKISTSTPEWINNSELREIYKEKNILSEYTGINYSVDHIIPINHEKVCGLHVPWNLQILTKSENSSKNNKFDGTYENESWRLDYEKKER